MRYSSLACQELQQEIGENRSDVEGDEQEDRVVARFGSEVAFGLAAGAGGVGGVAVAVPRVTLAMVVGGEERVVFACHGYTITNSTAFLSDAAD